MFRFNVHKICIKVRIREENVPWKLSWKFQNVKHLNVFKYIYIHRSNGRLFFCLFVPRWHTASRPRGIFVLLQNRKYNKDREMCTLRKETLILKKQQLLFHSEDIFLTESNAVFCSCNKIKRRIGLQFSAFGKQNRISLIAKSVGTIGHINNYVCLTTYNPLRYKDAKHCEASAWKKGRAVHGELRGAYKIRGLPHTHSTGMENQNSLNRNVYPEG